MYILHGWWWHAWLSCSFRAVRFFLILHFLWFLSSLWFLGWFLSLSWLGFLFLFLIWLMLTWLFLLSILFILFWSIVLLWASLFWCWFLFQVFTLRALFLRFISAMLSLFVRQISTPWLTLRLLPFTRWNFSWWTNSPYYLLNSSKLLVQNLIYGVRPSINFFHTTFFTLVVININQFTNIVKWQFHQCFCSHLFVSVLNHCHSTGPNLAVQNLRLECKCLNISIFLEYFT